MHTISHEWLPSEVPFAPYYLVRRTLHPRSLPQSHGLQVHVRTMLLHAGSPMFLRVLQCMARSTSACPCHAAACRAVQCSFGFFNAWHGLQVHVRAMLLHAGQSNVPSGSPMPGSLTEHMLAMSTRHFDGDFSGIRLMAIFQAFA